MNYQQMRAVANDMNAQAEMARSVIAVLQGDVKRLLPTWEGASKHAFQSTYDLCYKELERVPPMLDQVGQALSQTADTIEQAEQQASADIHATVTADDSQ
jgi:WXG100 family type VII secretion target